MSMVYVLQSLDPSHWHTPQRKAKPMSAPPSIMTSMPEVMWHIQSVIKETTVPSWIRSVPKNFGESKVGTLKADEWCMLATIYLPLALVSLWGEDSAHQLHEVKGCLQAILDNTMALVSVIHTPVLVPWLIHASKHTIVAYWLGYWHYQLLYQLVGLM